MKQYLDKIKNFFSKLTSKKVSYEEEGVNPYRDWGIIITISLFAIIVAGAIAYYFYNQINSNSFVSVEAVKSETEVKININLLNKIVQDLKDKEINLEKIKSGTSVPLDPSI